MDDKTSNVNVDLELSAKAELKLDVTKSFNNLTSKPAEVIGNVFAAKRYMKNRDLLVEHQKMMIDDHYAAEKYELLKKAELIAIKKANAIDEGNLMIPFTSDIIPPIDALDIFFDREHYRTMLSNLVASTFDKTAPVHPTFVEIIKRMSECDFMLFQDLYNIGQTHDITVAKTILIPTEESSIPHEFDEELIVHFPKLGEFEPQSLIFTEHERSNSIVNLLNLGLLTMNSKFSDDRPLMLTSDERDNITNPAYQFVKETTHYENMVGFYEPEYLVTAIKTKLLFTSIAIDFYHVCVE